VNYLNKEFLPTESQKKFTYVERKVNIQDHSLNTTLSVCKPAACFGYIYIYIYTLISFTNFNAQLFYPLTICMLHYNPRHVSRINMPIFRRKNFIITASDIVNLYTVQYSMPNESRLQSAFIRILYSRLQRATITDDVIIQFFPAEDGHVNV
jgi:hypothetical protein